MIQNLFIQIKTHLHIKMKILQPRQREKFLLTDRIITFGLRQRPVTTILRLNIFSQIRNCSLVQLCRRQRQAMCTIIISGVLNVFLNILNISKIILMITPSNVKIKNEYNCSRLFVYIKITYLKILLSIPSPFLSKSF